MSFVHCHVYCPGDKRENREFSFLDMLCLFQVPVVPLQRPDEMQMPSPSWMQTTSGYEDMCNEQRIPTMITWSYDGKEVAVEGSWDNWKTR